MIEYFITHSLYNIWQTSLFQGGQPVSSMEGGAFPHPKGMPSFWRKSPGDLDNHRTSAELPGESDIVIIGGGYSAGSFLTHFLSKYSAKNQSVLVIEARQLCSGATGRNGTWFISAVHQRLEP